jgi:hypothetical protein
MAQPLGLIAGAGRFPLLLAREARAAGLSVAAVALHGLTDPGLEAEVDAATWLHVGELEALVRTFRAGGVRDVVFAGAVPRTFVTEHPELLRPDSRALALVSRLADRKDDSILDAIAGFVEEQGFVLRGQAELVPALVAEPGVLGRVAPDARALSDLAFGWPIALAIGDLGVGQTILVRDRVVLAVEAVEGTDEAIRRAGRLGAPGACMLKVARPRQDLRSDLPAVGPHTIERLAEARASLVAVQAGAALLLDRDDLLAKADAAGIAVVGVLPGGRVPGRSER